MPLVFKFSGLNWRFLEFVFAFFHLFQIILCTAWTRTNLRDQGSGSCPLLLRMSASDQGLPPDPEPGPGPGDAPGLEEAQEAA